MTMTADLVRLEDRMEFLTDFLTTNGAKISGVSGELVECYAPLSIMNTQRVAVDGELVDGYVDDFRRDGGNKGLGNGQNTRTLTGLIVGEDALRVMDGYHRTATCRALGYDGVFTSSKISTIEDIYDRMIFEGKDHPGISFSRIVLWMKESWSLTEMSKHFELEQALTISGKINKGNRISDDPELVAQAVEWIEAKATKWKLKPMTIHAYMVNTRGVNPEIVLGVRAKTDGRKLTAPTQDMVKILSKGLPGEFEVQDILVGFAMKHNLGTSQFRTLVGNAKGASLFEVGYLLDTVDPKKIIGVKAAKSRTRGDRYDPTRRGEATLRPAIDVVDDIALRFNTRILPVAKNLSQEQIENLRHFQSSLRALEKQLKSLNGGLATVLGPDPADPVAAAKSKSKPKDRQVESDFVNKYNEITAGHKQAREIIRLSNDQYAAVNPDDAADTKTLTFRENGLSFDGKELDFPKESTMMPKVAKFVTSLLVDYVSGMGGVSGNDIMRATKMTVIDLKPNIIAFKAMLRNAGIDPASVFVENEPGDRPGVFYRIADRVKIVESRA